VKRIDGRTLSHETLEHLRKLAVDRVHGGEKPSEVSRSLGFCRTTIYKWLRAFQAKGPKALDSRKSEGPKPKLTDKQRFEVARWIVGKDPRQHGFDFGLWTRKIVAQLIEERFGVSFTLPSVGALLWSLDITPQKPLRRAYERDEKAIKEWKEKTYPWLRKRAAKAGAEIFFLDEAGVRSDSPLGRSYGLKGRKPIVKTSGQRQKINAISAVNPNGAFWFKIYNGTLSAALFISFLTDFLKTTQSSIILILDGLPSHKAKSVMDFIQAQKGKIELHFLPPYAPDLNPDEFVWHTLKQNGTSKKPLMKNESLKLRVLEDLEAIKQNISLIKSFFLSKSVAYTVY
jgi:transposase